MRRIAVVAGCVTALIAGTAGAALACGGLVAPNGTIDLLRTTTLAAYHGGVEHYVTSFEFAGGGGEFGSIVPLPGVPRRVIKGGDWTLQRLALETQATRRAVAENAVALDAAAAMPEVLLEKRIDALDVTILRGGATAVGNWARAHGFDLPPDAPEVLDFYARRSPVFMAAVFDADAAAARGQAVGDGTPVHLAIPTDRPWVPLRILGLGRVARERIGADVYLLTDDRPALLPAPGAGSGLELRADGPASESLLADLRSDRGMKWLPPADMWLTYLAVDAEAGALTHDLAVDPAGGRPSPVDAGLADPESAPPLPDGSSVALWAVAAAIAAAAVGAAIAAAADGAVARLR